MLLSIATFILALVTAWMAYQTKKLADYNLKIVNQSEKQHRERLRPYCIPLTNISSPILQFGEVIGPKSTINGYPQGYPQGSISGETNVVWVKVRNSGLGPAINVNIYFADNQEKRISKSFLVAHILAPGEEVTLFSEIPEESIKDDNGGTIKLSPDKVVDRTCFLICEYQSVFPGEHFHSKLAKGSGQAGQCQDDDQSRTSPVEFMIGKFEDSPLKQLR